MPVIKKGQEHLIQDLFSLRALQKAPLSLWDFGNDYTGEKQGTPLSKHEQTFFGQLLKQHF